MEERYDTLIKYYIDDIIRTEFIINDKECLKYLINICNINEILIRIIDYGCFEMAKWLYSIWNMNTPIDYEYVFRYSCRSGYFKIAKWLYSFGNVNIHIDNEYVFQCSCANGYFKMAKWLYSLGNVNIHVYNEYVFRCSCGYGHFKMSKWLYSLGNVDIPINNEYALRLTSINGHFKITKWLYSLDNNYVFRWSSALCISYKDKQYFNIKKIIYKPGSNNYMKLLSLYNNKIYKI